MPEGFLGLLCIFDRPHPFMALTIALVVFKNISRRMRFYDWQSRMILLLSVSRSTSNKVADTDMVPLSRERDRQEREWGSKDRRPRRHYAKGKCCWLIQNTLMHSIPQHTLPHILNTYTKSPGHTGPSCDHFLTAALTLSWPLQAGKDGPTLLLHSQKPSINSVCFLDDWTKRWTKLWPKSIQIIIMLHVFYHTLGFQTFSMICIYYQCKILLTCSCTTFKWFIKNRI